MESLMKDINTVKSEAEILMATAARFGHNLQQTHAYEILARLAGCRNWSTYRTQLEMSPKLASEPATVRQALNEFVRWYNQAPLEELDCLEEAIGIAPSKQALEALNSPANALETATLLETALRSCAEWLERAPVDELEAVEDAVGNAPVKQIHEALGDSVSKPVTREDVVEDIVEDVRGRARRYGFSHSGRSQAAMLARESARLLGYDLTRDELAKAVDELY